MAMAIATTSHLRTRITGRESTAILLMRLATTDGAPHTAAGDIVVGGVGE